MAVVEGCPAFVEGCPFSKMQSDLLPSIMKEFEASLAERCPAFKEGCPFKDMDSVETLYNKLSEMPSSHQPTSNLEAGKAVGEALQLVHVKSVELKGQMNASCPVFATSCPFKTVTSYGAPLVSELDLVIEHWGLSEIMPEQHVGVTEARIGADEAVAVEPLSKSLKAGTKLVHRSAENVQFVRSFLKGSVPKDSYIDLLRALYHVYHAMEVALEELPNHLKHCDFTVIKRAEALATDLRFYLGVPEGETFDAGTPSPAAKQYVEHIQRTATEDPLMILAHAYTRYLGDLSGGQILAKSAEKAYKLPANKGLAFYKFEQLGNSPAELKAFKKAYRLSLDALDISANRADALVREANTAFLMNISLFEERDVAAGYLDRIRTLEEINELIDSNRSALQFQKAYGAKSSEVVAQCPFIPGAAGQRKEDEPSFHGGGGICPWPFIWLHEPKSAIVSHPVKNVTGLLAMFGLLRVASRYPRRSAGVFFASVITLLLLKPKKKNAPKP